MGLLDQILGAALGGQKGGAQAGGLGGLGDLLAGLAGGRQQQSSGGGGASLLTALLPVVVSMLANRGGGGGAAGPAAGGGLDGLLKQFQAAGLGQQADSWVGSGPNMAVSADDITRVLGHDNLSQIAARAGIGEQEASDGLASLLPEFVNQLTPRGELPQAGELDDALSSLRRSLGL